jgi:DNA polymerase III sliding clamp (beta) subunit (PCNA family)
MKTMTAKAELFFLAARFVSHPKRNMSHIEGVYIEPNGLCSRLVATDGHRMIVFEDDSPSEDRFEIVINPVKGLLSACRQSGLDKHLEITEDGSVSVLDVCGNCLYRSPSSLKLDVIFPAYTQVIPKSFVEQTGVLSLGLCASYLEDFEFGKSELRIIPGKSLDPIVVLNDAYPNMLGILMPSRMIEELIDLSRWRKEEGKKTEEER